VINIQSAVRRVLVVLFWIFVPATAFAQEVFGITPSTMTNTGVSGIWILANISYPAGASSHLFSVYQGPF
jgi:hypothetical protein